MTELCTPCAPPIQIMTYIKYGGCRSITGNRIIEAVVRHSQIPFEELEIKDRYTVIVSTRRLCYYLLLKYTRMTQSRVGAVFGQDHSNVHHHYGIAVVRYDVYESERNYLSNIEDDLLQDGVIPFIVDNGNRLSYIDDSRYRKFTVQEINVIKQNYNRKTAKQISALIDRKPSSVANKMTRMGLTQSAHKKNR